MKKADSLTFPIKFLLSVGCGLIALLAVPNLHAQAPASIRGDALYLTITGGSGTTFSSAGYSLVFPGNSANSYTRVELVEGTTGSGTFTYSAGGSNAVLAVTDSGVGAFNADYTYTDAEDGTFAFSKLATSSTENGRFADYYGTAPASLVGSSITGTINDGATNSDSSGTFSLAFNSPSSLTITDTGGAQHTATYTLSSVNRSTAKIIATQTGGKVTTVYFSFVDATGGGFGMRNNQAGWEIGTFTFQGAPDTTRPTLTITAPVANAHLSNQVATVTGTAHDNVAVANVFVSADGVNWTNAATANFDTNWTANVSLAPGANTIQAYAVDGSGNISATNRVSVTYIVSGTLTVGTNGNGTISPNYNGSSLQISNRYTMTATPAAGFAFTSWTDINNAVVTTNRALTFTMTSNLVYTANFVDVQKPVLTITSPTPGQHASNVNFTITGKATDNVGVTDVYYNYNNGGWNPANPGSTIVTAVAGHTIIANSWSNWTAQVTLVPGTNNTVSAYAVDGAGNVSKTNTVSWTYIVSAPLTLSLSGRGTISPNYSNAFLQISNHYSITAAPGAGFAFVDWTDGNGIYVTNKATLSFVMATNLSFAANFRDVQKPTLTITTPTTTSVVTTNGSYTVSGKASDNLEVYNVYFQTNNSAWTTATTFNNWTNWTVTLDLAPGTNIFTSYSEDTTGNVSTTNTIKIVYQTASTALSGLLATITPDSGTTVQTVAFGASTFSQTSTDTNSGNIGVGDYTYTKQTPISGLLKITYTAPPSITDTNGAQMIHLAFTAANVARFTNGVDTGDIVFSSTPTLLPSSLTGRTVVFANNQGDAGYTRFAATQAIGLNLQLTTNQIRNYTFTAYSPVGGLIKQTGSNSVSYTLATFAATNYGQSYSEQYDASNNLTGSDVSVFGFASQRAGGNAPTNLINRTVVFTTDAGTDQLNFPDGGNFNDLTLNSSGNYSYNTTGTNSAALNLSYSSSATSLLLQFASPNFALFTNNVDGTIGSAVLK